MTTSVARCLIAPMRRGGPLIGRKAQIRGTICNVCNTVVAMCHRRYCTIAGYLARCVAASRRQRRMRGSGRSQEPGNRRGIGGGGGQPPPSRWSSTCQTSMFLARSGTPGRKYVCGFGGLLGCASGGRVLVVCSFSSLERWPRWESAGNVFVLCTRSSVH
jgi:hypothetical protein